MRQRILFILFLLSAAAQIFLTVSSVVFNENVLSKGTTHRFRTEPVDPYDPFRGKYVALDFDLSLFTGDFSRYEDKEKVYVLIDKDENSYSFFSAISDKKPASGDYLRLKVDSIRDGEVYFEIPFDRYYIDEDYAEEAETAYWDSNSANEAYVEVRVLGGHAVLDELYLGGMPVMEYLRL